MTKINTRARVKQWRLWLAQRMAPPGADVHDPDETACLGYELPLSNVFFSRIQSNGRGRQFLDVTDDLDDLAGYVVLEGGRWPGYYSVIDHDDTGRWMLTDAGERQLARMWGADRIPPWAHASLGECERHGDYDVFPGDRIGCPRCAIERPLWHPTGHA
jgi:hypothetical protein